MHVGLIYSAVPAVWECSNDLHLSPPQESKRRADASCVVTSVCLRRRASPGLMCMPSRLTHLRCSRRGCGATRCELSLIQSSPWA